MSERPRAAWEYTERGMRSVQERRLEGGAVYRRITKVLLPSVRIVPSVAAGGGFQRANRVGWHLPIDDIRTRLYSFLGCRSATARR